MPSDLDEAAKKTRTKRVKRRNGGGGGGGIAGTGLGGIQLGLLLSLGVVFARLRQAFFHN